MDNVAVLQKVLQIREQEKTIAQKEKNEATVIFEKQATALYELLKKKEHAEVLMNQYMQTYTSIEKIKEQSMFIQSMTRKASTLQQNVQQAREKMLEKQAYLTKTHIEMKKIEKLIERKKQARQEELIREENILMDELSIRQFTSSIQNR